MVIECVFQMDDYVERDREIEMEMKMEIEMEMEIEREIEIEIEIEIETDMNRERSNVHKNSVIFISRQIERENVKYVGGFELV